MIKTFNHTGFVVRDLDSSVKFYRDVVGMVYVTGAEREGGPISKVVGYENVHLKFALLATDEGHQLELIQYVNPHAAERPTEERSVLGATHLAFDVEDIDRAYEELVARGAVSLSTPVQVAPGKRVCYMQDPDRNWIELVEIKPVD